MALSPIYNANSSGLLSNAESKDMQYRNALLGLGTGLSKQDASGNILKFNPTGSLAQAWDAAGNRLSGSQFSNLVAANPVTGPVKQTMSGTASDAAIRNLLLQQGVAKGIGDDVLRNATLDQLKAAAMLTGKITPAARTTPQQPPAQQQQFIPGVTPGNAPGMVRSAMPSRPAQPTLDPRSGILYGTGNANISDQQIRSFITNAPNNQAILDAAVQNNISVDQISRAMGGQGGFDTNNITKYLAQQGITRPPISSPKDLTGGQPPATTGQSGALNLQPGQLNMDGATAAYINMLQQQATNANNLNLDISGKLQQAMQQNIANAPSVNYTPAQLAQTKVTPQMTVQGQLATILKNNSPLMQQARTEAQQQAARQGLLNSSLAGTAGEQALLKQALGIATPDAETYRGVGMANTQAANQMNLANAQNSMQAQQINSANILQRNIANAELGAKVGMFNADLVYRGADADANRRFQNYQLNTTLATDLFGRQMDNDNKLKLQEIEQRYQKDIQGSLNASNMYNGLIDQMGRINAMDVPGDAKQSMLNNLFDVFDSQMGLQQKMLGLSTNLFQGTNGTSSFRTTSSQANTPGFDAKAPQFVNQSTGATLGRDTNIPTKFNTVGGSISTDLAKKISTILKIDPRFVVTIDQKNANKQFSRTVENLVETGRMEKISLEKYLGQAPGGMLGGSKKLHEPLDQLFRLMDGHVYYDYSNALGNAKPAGA